MSNEEDLCNKGEPHKFERDDEVLGKRTCSIEVDDPGWDGTGYEHPAFKRGEDHGIEQVVRIINKVLDGEAIGILADPDLQKLRERIKELTAEALEG